MIYNPHPYQDFSTKHIVDNKAAGLLLEMGLGKTVSTLTAVDVLIYQELEVQKVLVIAPKRVAQHTWTTERDKWEHLKHLKISVVVGSEKERKAALKAKADIYVINRENVVWLVNLFGLNFPFDMVVIDELSSFKSAKAARFKALRQIRPKINRVVGLTGTPAPNGLLDLWSQMYLLDVGERLGKTLTEYRGKYFKKDPYKPYADYEVITEKDALIGESYYEKKIYEKISDICVSMKASDYLTLPKRIDTITEVHLSAEHLEKYYEFEKAQVLAYVDELEGEKQITAVNAAALTTKLLQFANGAVYNQDKSYYEIHNEKLEALDERIEALNGKSALVFYWFQHDLARLEKHFKHLKPRVLKTNQDIEDWNAGKIQIAFAHPASVGHGLNLQFGGHHIFWFSHTWSLELVQQAIARLDRQGQMFAVINDRLVVVGTIEEDVLKSLEDKDARQEALMNAVKARVHKYTGKNL